MRIFLFLYWLNMSVIGFYLIYADKKKVEQRAYRISEKSLWTVILLGGANSYFLGMKKFRHKTKHATFRIDYGLLFILQLIFFGYVLIF